MHTFKNLIEYASQYKRLESDIKRIEQADIINEKILASSLKKLLKIRESIQGSSSEIEEPLENFPERKLLREIRRNKDFIARKAIEKIPQLKKALLSLKDSSPDEFSDMNIEALIENFHNNPEEALALFLEFTSKEEQCPDTSNKTKDDGYLNGLDELHEKIDPYQYLTRKKEFSVLSLGRNIPPIVKKYFSLIRNSYLVASDSGSAVFCRSLLEVITYHILERDRKKHNINYPISISGGKNPQDSILSNVLERTIIKDDTIRDKARQVRWNVNKIMHPHSKIDRNPSYIHLRPLEIIRNTFEVIEYLYP